MPEALSEAERKELMKLVVKNLQRIDAYFEETPLPGDPSDRSMELLERLFNDLQQMQQMLGRATGT
jgi:hypothetical protein